MYNVLYFNYILDHSNIEYSLLSDSLEIYASLLYWISYFYYKIIPYEFDYYYKYKVKLTLFYIFSLI